MSAIAPVSPPWQTAASCLLFLSLDLPSAANPRLLAAFLLGTP